MPPSRTLWIECALAYGALPACISLLKPHGWIYITLWVAGALAWHGCRRHGVRWKAEWNFSALNREVIKKIGLRFIPCALALLVFTWVMIPEHLFGLPRERPLVWVMVMVLYPLLSVVPQEIIFRSYFFRRFAPIFSDQTINLASAIAFGWVHIVLQNWVAVVFSGVGGWLFADTYRKTGSLAAVCFEHALYGCYLFTIGLGFYFYHGNAVK